jgi:nitroreductase
MTVAEEIIELARWAPSGDNSQPWRFRTLAEDHILVQAFDTREHCVYDLEGQASQLAVGAMLETMRIAASASGRKVAVVRRPESPDRRPVFDVRVGPAGVVAVDDLIHAIRDRCVQRRPMSTEPLGAARKARLEAAVGPAARVVWFEGMRHKLRMAWLGARSAKIRLTIPEAYAVHRDIIQWGARHSVDRVPDQALGASRPTIALMRWAMHSWARVDRMNRFAGGTIAPRLELDIVPALRCAGHFAILADEEPRSLDDFLAAGAATQRFWLTASSLGLQLQPHYTPLVFAGYARRGIEFTAVPQARARAVEVGALLEAMLPGSSGRAVFLGRLGEGPPAESRSLRLSVDELAGSPPAIREGSEQDRAQGVARMS